MPFRKIFLSRWSALIWAGGVLWTAVDIVGVAPASRPHAAFSGNDTDATGVEFNASDLAILANAP